MVAHLVIICSMQYNVVTTVTVDISKWIVTSVPSYYHCYCLCNRIHFTTITNILTHRLKSDRETRRN